MRILRLAGNPRQMGEAFGESCREAIGELYLLRLENAVGQARRYGNPAASEAQLLALARACLPPTRDFDPEGFAELEGIARGSGLGLPEVLAMNGLTDLRDALAWGGQLEAVGGCTAVLVQRDASRSGQVMFAQTWDLASDNRPYVVAVQRKPVAGCETWCVTTVGCLSLCGINAHGLCMGTTNLRTTDARPGVPYLSVIHRALQSQSFAEAVGIVRGARRAGGHSYLLAHAAGDVGVVECSATRSALLALSAGTLVQTNHCQVPGHRDLEADTPLDSSLARLRRMRSLLESTGEVHDVAALQGFLADRENGELAICRDDFAGISTNAAVVAVPEEPSFWACQGLPSQGDWIDLRAV